MDFGYLERDQRRLCRRTSSCHDVTHAYRFPWDKHAYCPDRSLYGCRRLTPLPNQSALWRDPAAAARAARVLLECAGTSILPGLLHGKGSVLRASRRAGRPGHRDPSVQLCSRRTPPLFRCGVLGGEQEAVRAAQAGDVLGHHSDAEIQHLGMFPNRLYRQQEALAQSRASSEKELSERTNNRLPNS
jgi:hypothetical protein